MSKPKLTLLIDVERSYLSVAHLLRTEQNPEGTVIRVRAPRFKDVQAAMYDLHRGKLLSEDDLGNLGAVVVDTVSTLATNTRRDIIKEGEALFDIWGKRGELFPQLRDWGSMTDVIGRLFSGFASWSDENEVPFIILAHERIAADEITGAKKGGPDLNNALLADVMENSDFVWRIWKEEAAVKLANGSYPAGTHFLRLATSESKMTKRRIIPELASRMPDNLPNPTLPQVFNLLGPFIPNVLTIYGPPGAGKTTLACSFSDPKNYA